MIRSLKFAGIPVKDQDAALDFYVGTGDPDFSTLIPNRMFRNDRGRRFQEVTTSGGFGHVQVIPLPPDHALVSAAFSCSVTDTSGGVFRNQGTTTWLWLNVNGQWRIVYGQIAHEEFVDG